MASPFIKCDKHGTVKGYSVCNHIIDDGAKPRVIFPPRDKCLGLITCGTPANNESIVKMRLCCEVCLADSGIISKTVIAGGSMIHEDIIE